LMCTEGFPYKTYGVRKRNLGIASIFIDKSKSMYVTIP
jgi:hypothetical protein